MQELHHSTAAACYLTAVLEAGAGVDVAELDEPDSLPLDVFDSVFDSVLAPDSDLPSVPVFFSAGADSVAELLPSEELPFAP